MYRLLSKLLFAAKAHKITVDLIDKGKGTGGKETTRNLSFRIRRKRHSGDYVGDYIGENSTSFVCRINVYVV